MGSSANKIEKKRLRAMAEETRRQAGIYQKQGMEEAKGITQDSNAALSQTMAMLGKSGSLGVTGNAEDLQAIETDVDTGSLDSDTAKELRASIAAKETALKEEDGTMKAGGVTTVKDFKDLKNDKEDLARITKGTDDIGEITTGDIGNLTSGSTALNLKNFQDKLTKARNSYVNQVQEDTFSAYKSAENADAQAALHGKAEAWATVSKIGGTVVGGILGFALGGPAGSALWSGGLKATGTAALIGYGSGVGR